MPINKAKIRRERSYRIKALWNHINLFIISCPLTCGENRHHGLICNLRGTLTNHLLAGEPLNVFHLIRCNKREGGATAEAVHLAHADAEERFR